MHSHSVVLLFTSVTTMTLCLLAMFLESFWFNRPEVSSFLPASSSMPGTVVAPCSAPHPNCLCLSTEQGTQGLRVSRKTHYSWWMFISSRTLIYWYSTHSWRPRQGRGKGWGQLETMRLAQLYNMQVLKVSSLFYAPRPFFLGKSPEWMQLFLTPLLWWIQTSAAS